MNKLLKSKAFLVAIVVLSLVNVAWNIFGMNRVVQRIPTPLQQQFGAASNELKNRPPGIQRGEVFLQKLKAINISNAPIEQQQALKAYIAAQEQALDALKKGGDTKSADQKLGIAAHELSKSFHQ